MIFLFFSSYKAFSIWNSDTLDAIVESAKWHHWILDKSSELPQNINIHGANTAVKLVFLAKGEHSVWRGFVIITLMLKAKRKTAKTYNPVWHVFKKKKKVKEGPDYICSVRCLVNYHINREKLFFPCVSQSTPFLLLLAQTWRKARLEQCKENS